jgi:hypothetical protein
MATTGTKLTVPFTVGAGAVVGQGIYPELWALYSTDDASVGAPVWTDATALTRSFRVSRGRENEQSEMSAGTASVTLDNRTRVFDPAFNSAIRPLNRWWLREQFTGETQDMFLGYAESYEQQWDVGAPSDAVTVVNCADEFKVLALANLPTTSPPRDNYADVVAFDSPDGYWDMNASGFATTLLGNPGGTLVLQGAVQFDSGAGAIVGQEPEGDIFLDQGNYYSTVGLVQGDAGDTTSAAEFTIEGWFSTDTPATVMNWIVGPTAGAASTWRLFQDTGTVKFEARNSAGTLVTISGGTLTGTGGTSSGSPPGPWSHVVGVIRAGNIYLYVNGVQVATAAWAGSFATTLDAGAGLFVGPNVGSSTSTVWIDEVAFYRYGLTAATVASHYQAGQQRGFARGHTADTRCGTILDAVTSHAPRSIRTGTRNLVGSYMVGQAPLDELRKARSAENVDAMLFIARDGTVTLLDAAHRSVSPWSTVQATFGDAGGAELPYHDIAVDFSDSFLTNEWNVTGLGGTDANGKVQTASDATSITRYYKRSQSVTDVPVPSDAQVAVIATALLAKYKDPLTRDHPHRHLHSRRRRFGGRVPA